MCGHQAIVHKPPGGNPHIDFVVNDKVECFAGCNPLMDTEAFWPSNFSVEEAAADLIIQSDLGEDCNINMLTEHQRQVLHQQQQNQQNIILHQQQGCCVEETCKLPKKDPKLFDLKDIDFDDDEWSPIRKDDENTEEDERLLGNLFSLKQHV